MFQGRIDLFTKYKKKYSKEPDTRFVLVSNEGPGVQAN
jgi:hypothetical protein